MSNYSWRRPLMNTIVYSTALCGFIWGVAYAAEEEELQEIIVTAQKRSEDIQKVPVVVTAVSSEQLTQESIREPQDLARVVPSLRMPATPSTSTGVFTDIRGQVASDVILNINQAVGLYEDGVDIPHPEGSNAALFDLQRVEVLNGPQGTLYGRNTTGGSVNLFTKGADFEGVHGYAGAEYGNDDDWKVNGAINLPLIPDELAVRLAVQHWGREGFGESVVTGERLGADHDDTTARLSVLFEPLSTLRFDFRGEYDELHRHGDLITARGYDPTIAGGSSFAAPLEVGLETNSALALDLLTNNVGPIIAGGTAGILGAIGLNPATAVPTAQGNFVGNNIMHSTTGTYDFEHVHGWHFSLNSTWDITDTISLKSITGYHQFVDFHVVDLAATPYQLGVIGAGSPQLQPVVGNANFPALPDEEDSFVSQEFDLTGRVFDQRINWLLGAYYSHDSGNGAQPSISFPALSALGSVTCFGAPGAPTTYTKGEAGPLGACSPDGLYTYDQKSVIDDSYAVFTQDDFKITDQLTFTLGGRYTWDRLRQDISTWAYDASPYGAATPFTPVPGLSISDPYAGLYICPLLNPTPVSASNSICDVHQRANFSAPSWLFSLNYQLTDAMMTYAKAAYGYRGGALQARAALFPPAKPETDHDYELGFKSAFFDHRLVTNVALYEDFYANKQVTQVIYGLGSLPIPSTPIINAATETIKGFEAQLTALVFTGLTVNASLSYTDATYDKFGTPACNGASPAPTGCALTPLNVGYDASGTPAGEPLWRYNLGGRYVIPVWADQRLGIEADWSWKSHIPITQASADPTFPTLQQQFYESVGIMNARIDYDFPGSGWNVALFATNLLNKHYQIASLDAAALGNGIPTGITQEPLMYGVQIRKSFGGE
jgi:iron complex outermembrane receptor protein